MGGVNDTEIFIEMLPYVSGVDSVVGGVAGDSEWHRDVWTFPS